jgi:hypothetical protein
LLGRLLNVLTPEYETPFWTQDKLTTGRNKSFLFLVSKLCTYALVRNSFWLTTMDNIKDNIRWHAKGKILSFLNRLLHESVASEDSQELPSWHAGKILVPPVVWPNMLGSSAHWKTWKGQYNVQPWWRELPDTVNAVSQRDRLLGL